MFYVIAWNYGGTKVVDKECETLEQAKEYIRLENHDHAYQYYRIAEQIY